MMNRLHHKLSHLQPIYSQQDYAVLKSKLLTEIQEWERQRLHEKYKTMREKLNIYGSFEQTRARNDNDYLKKCHLWQKLIVNNPFYRSKLESSIVEYWNVELGFQNDNKRDKINLLCYKSKYGDKNEFQVWDTGICSIDEDIAAFQSVKITLNETNVVFSWPNHELSSCIFNIIEDESSANYFDELCAKQENIDATEIKISLDYLNSVTSNDCTFKYPIDEIKFCHIDSIDDTNIINELTLNIDDLDVILKQITNENGDIYLDALNYYQHRLWFALYLHIIHNVAVQQYLFGDCLWSVRIYQYFMEYFENSSFVALNKNNLELLGLEISQFCYFLLKQLSNTGFDSCDTFKLHDQIDVYYNSMTHETKEVEANEAKEFERGILMDDNTNNNGMEYSSVYNQLKRKQKKMTKQQLMIRTYYELDQILAGFESYLMKKYIDARLSVVELSDNFINIICSLGALVYNAINLMRYYGKSNCSMTEKNTLLTNLGLSSSKMEQFTDKSFVLQQIYKKLLTLCVNNELNDKLTLFEDDNALIRRIFDLNRLKECLKRLEHKNDDKLNEIICWIAYVRWMHLKFNNTGIEVTKHSFIAFSSFINEVAAKCVQKPKQLNGIDVIDDTYNICYIIQIFGEADSEILQKWNELKENKNNIHCSQRLNFYDNLSKSDELSKMREIIGTNSRFGMKLLANTKLFLDYILNIHVLENKTIAWNQICSQIRDVNEWAEFGMKSKKDKTVIIPQITNSYNNLLEFVNDWNRATSNVLELECNGLKCRKQTNAICQLFADLSNQLPMDLNRVQLSIRIVNQSGQTQMFDNIFLLDDICNIIKDKLKLDDNLSGINSHDSFLCIVRAVLCLNVSANGGGKRKRRNVTNNKLTLNQRRNNHSNHSNHSNSKGGNIRVRGSGRGGLTKGLNRSGFTSVIRKHQAQADALQSDAFWRKFLVDYKDNCHKTEEMIRVLEEVDYKGTVDALGLLRAVQQFESSELKSIDDARHIHETQLRDYVRKCCVKYCRDMLEMLRTFFFKRWIVGNASKQRLQSSQNKTVKAKVDALQQPAKSPQRQIQVKPEPSKLQQHHSQSQQRPAHNNSSTSNDTKRAKRTRRIPKYGIKSAKSEQQHAKRGQKRTFDTISDTKSNHLVVNPMKKLKISEMTDICNFIRLYLRYVYWINNLHLEKLSKATSDPFDVSISLDQNNASIGAHILTFKNLYMTERVCKLDHSISVQSSLIELLLWMFAKDSSFYDWPWTGEQNANNLVFNEIYVFLHSWFVLKNEKSQITNFQVIELVKLLQDYDCPLKCSQWLFWELSQQLIQPDVSYSHASHLIKEFVKGLPTRVITVPSSYLFSLQLTTTLSEHYGLQLCGIILNNLEIDCLVDKQLHKNRNIEAIINKINERVHHINHKLCLQSFGLQKCKQLTKGELQAILLTETINDGIILQLQTNKYSLSLQRGELIIVAADTPVVIDPNLSGVVFLYNSNETDADYSVSSVDEKNIMNDWTTQKLYIVGLGSCQASQNQFYDDNHNTWYLESQNQKMLDAQSVKAGYVNCFVAATRQYSFQDLSKHFAHPTLIGPASFKIVDCLSLPNDSKIKVEGKNKQAPLQNMIGNTPGSVQMQNACHANHLFRSWLKELQQKYSGITKDANPRLRYKNIYPKHVSAIEANIKGWENSNDSAPLKHETVARCIYCPKHSVPNLLHQIHRRGSLTGYCVLCACSSIDFIEEPSKFAEKHGISAKDYKFVKNKVTLYNTDAFSQCIDSTLDELLDLMGLNSRNAFQTQPKLLPNWLQTERVGIVTSNLKIEPGAFIHPINDKTMWILLTNQGKYSDVDAPHHCFHLYPRVIYCEKGNILIGKMTLETAVAEMSQLEDPNWEQIDKKYIRWFPLEAKQAVQVDNDCACFILACCNSLVRIEKVSCVGYTTNVITYHLTLLQVSKKLPQRNENDLTWTYLRKQVESDETDDFGQCTCLYLLLIALYSAQLGDSFFQTQIKSLIHANKTIVDEIQHLWSKLTISAQKYFASNFWSQYVSNIFDKCGIKTDSSVRF